MAGNYEYTSDTITIKIADLDLDGAIEHLGRHGGLNGTTRALTEALAKIRKAEQPTGRWAVVEDVDGVEWGRVGDTPIWRDADALRISAHWKDLNVARVVSEGVE